MWGQAFGPAAALSGGVAAYSEILVLVAPLIRVCGLTSAACRSGAFWKDESYDHLVGRQIVRADSTLHQMESFQSGVAERRRSLRGRARRRPKGRRHH